MSILSLFGVFAAAADVNQNLIDLLPEDVARIIQDHTLDLYKFQHSPSAPISNLTETNDYFPTLRYGRIKKKTAVYSYVFDPTSNVEYTMPTDRYLSLYILRERSEYRSVALGFKVTDGNCDGLGIYYYDGEGTQVLEGGDETEGITFMKNFFGTIHLLYRLNYTPEELCGRQVMLYIPPDCTLRFNYATIGERATDDTLEGTERTITTE